MNFIIEFIIQYIILILPALLAVAYVTLMERKILGSIQRRQGPNAIGIFGLLQPFADALKLLLKEFIQPFQANEQLFLLAPILSFGLSLLGQVVLPLSPNYVLIDVNLGIIYILSISSLSVYGIIIAGQSSNSRYSFLGALRSTAQLIAYEISIGFILLTLVLPINSFNLLDFVFFQTRIQLIIPYTLSFIMFFISMLAELNRPPFDLPEAEAELVSGYNVEYSAVGFALFFIGEYMHIIFLSILCSMLFLGGQHIPFITTQINSNFQLYSEICYFVFVSKTVLLITAIIQCRSILPRYRYDQLMFLGQKIFLPLSITWFFFVFTVLYQFDGLPILSFYLG